MALVSSRERKSFALSIYQFVANLLDEVLDAVVTLLTRKKRLERVVEKLRKEEYQRGNAVHEGKLLELWRLLKPDDKISACTGKHWRTLGFQSDDPSRDFRGMGILSLDQLIYMARNEPRCMRSIVVLSNHPRIGFPLVITG
ncbi:hypothetical protein Q1695_000905 [Nippostrongylus brasiliensis]|nr:hypothetical protein Q1695_000905 [Nippostrongylus brasiliensis]